MRSDDSLHHWLGTRAPRVLHLTRNAELLSRQLAGESVVPFPSSELADDVSTDETTPAHACYFYDERITEWVYTGLRGAAVPKGAVFAGRFSILASGCSKGCGSSREIAPFAEYLSGIRLVVARSFEKIYRQNCHNIGLLTTTDFGVLERLIRGEPVKVAEILADLDPMSRAIVSAGGLLAYLRERAGRSAGTELRGGPERPRTCVEKILSAHRSAAVGQAPVELEPGDSLFVTADVRFSHEYVTAMADALFRRGFGESARVVEPETLLLFRDHLTLLPRSISDEHRRLGLLEQATLLAALQADFAERQGLRVYGEVQADGASRGSHGICHNVVLEEVALPGQIVVGTDSHTCMAGAVGCLAFGVGSTDMAAAFRTKEVRARVPETVRVELSGALGPLVSAKDAMLSLLATDACRSGQFIGRVLEYGGAGLAALSMDERATLANMAAEAGAFTAFVEVDAAALEWLSSRRKVPVAELERRVVATDPGATYALRVELDLSSVEPMIASPGDPRSGRPVREFLAEHGEVPVDIAYGGSCAGGKSADLDAYARFVALAVASGVGVSPRSRFFVQAGSQEVRKRAEEQGQLALFRRAGVELVDPACGACIRAGPGVSSHASQVTISAASRNYEGRSGPGKVYLGSPFTVAASAVEGRIADPRAVLERLATLRTA